MVSISHVVEDIVKHRPYLSESLAAGIINVSSLARQLQPDVERALQKGVNCDGLESVGALFAGAGAGAVE